MVRFERYQEHVKQVVCKKGDVRAPLLYSSIASLTIPPACM